MITLKVCQYNTVSTLSNWTGPDNVGWSISMCDGSSRRAPFFTASCILLLSPIFDNLWPLIVFVEFVLPPLYWNFLLVDFHCFSCLRYALWVLNFPKILFTLYVAKVYLLLILKNMLLLASILLNLHLSYDHLFLYIKSFLVFVRYSWSSQC